MNFKNYDGRSYMLQIYLKEDVEVTEISYDLDNENKSIYISNKGFYSIYLGRFSKLSIKDHSKCIYELVVKTKDYSKFFKKFKVTLEKEVPDSIVIKNKPYIFDDLTENNGNDLYCSFNRLLKITLKYNETKESSLLEDIKYGLDFLMNNWYTGTVNYSGNWWFYEIGVPRCLNEILFLIKNDIEPSIMYDYLNKERFYLPNAEIIFYRRNYPVIYREYATYANLAENIYICTLRAILQDTYVELDSLFNMIEKTVKYVNSGDGFYLDGSFIQHNNVPYNASYGEVLMISLSKILNVFYLLNFDCEIYVKKIQDLLFESYSPFLFDGKALECVRGRAVSRMSKNSKYSFEAIMSSVNRLKRLFSTPKLKSFIKIEENRSYIKYAKSFNFMDRFISRNRKYLFSINLNSNYICNYENINGENLLGDYSSNFTFDLLYPTDDLKYDSPLYVNPFYRNGSTNTFDREEPNYVYENKITAGADLDDLLTTCWHQNTDVKGYFSKFVLNKSLIAIGTDISSDKEYVSTIYNTEYDYEIDNDSVSFKDIKVFTNDEYEVKVFNESRCPKDLNINQSEDYIDYSMTRMFMRNPKSYEYQIYPDYDGIKEKYEIIKLNGCHILRFNNYLMINSFENEEVRFENIKFKGRFSGILSFKNDKYYLNISTGKRCCVNIEFAINDYKMIYENHAIKSNTIEISDELIHSITFKK